MKIGFLLLFFSISSYGFLGEVKPKGSTDPVQIYAKSKIASSLNYQIEIKAVEGVEITEYITEGKVFAITWSGLTHPDLSILLGSYWPEYKKQNPRSERRKALNTVRSNSLVVEKGGRMREVFGKAYDTSLMPEGFDPNDL